LYAYHVLGENPGQKRKKLVMTGTPGRGRPLIKVKKGCAAWPQRDEKRGGEVCLVRARGGRRGKKVKEGPGKGGVG